MIRGQTAGLFKRAELLASNLTFVGLSGGQVDNKVGELERELHYWGNEIESHVDNLLIDVRELKNKVDWIDILQAKKLKAVAFLSLAFS